MGFECTAVLPVTTPLVAPQTYSDSTTIRETIDATLTDALLMGTTRGRKVGIGVLLADQ